MIRFLALLAFLCSFALLCPAQVVMTNGCYEAATGRIYVGTSCGFYILVCNGTDPDNEFAVRGNTTNVDCGACRSGGTFGPFTVTGKQTNYTVYHCPLDRGIIVLALFSSAMGLYFLRLRKGTVCLKNI